jgi:hypothetical protein
VSPLHRAIQTAQITFEDFRGKVPFSFVAHEACREELGLLVCNKRRPLSETIREFPNVDFSLVTSGEEDALLSPETSSKFIVIIGVEYDRNGSLSLIILDFFLILSSNIPHRRRRLQAEFGALSPAGRRLNSRISHSS